MEFKFKLEPNVDQLFDAESPCFWSPIEVILSASSFSEARKKIIKIRKDLSEELHTSIHEGLYGQEKRGEIDKEGIRKRTRNLDRRDLVYLPKLISIHEKGAPDETMQMLNL